MSIILTFLALFVFLICVFPCITEDTHKYVYSEICGKGANENESSVYCMKDHKKKNSLYVYKHIMKFFIDKYKSIPNEIALVEHSYGEPQNYITYDNFFRKVSSFSHTLNTYEGKGIESKKYNEKQNNGIFKLLGIYGSNSINWLASDLSAMMSGVTTLVMHSKFSIDVIVDILNETQLEWLCLDLDLVEGLLNHINELPHLKNLIILDTLSKNKEINLNKEENNNDKKNKSSGNSTSVKGNDLSNMIEITCSGPLEYDKEKLKKYNELKKKCEKCGKKLMLFDDMTKTQTKKFTIKNEDPDFVTSIVYTSGTSGKPKGVMLSNKNIYNQLFSLYNHSVRERYSFKNHLSYLPISHVFERTFAYSILMYGGTLNVWGKDINYFSKDIYNTKENIMGGVPKVFCRIYTNIMTEIDNLPSPKRRLVRKILSLRKSDHNGPFSKFLESIFHISKKIKDKVNPNLEIILSGGGKLSPDIAEEFCYLLNIKYCQGYGLTETAGAILGNHADDEHFEYIGGPIAPNTKYKVRTWETYKATDTLPKGELLIKSDSMFSGYFLEKECTKNAFTDDGYFKTGDIVQINDNGSVTFLDRSKGLVKLSQGEYIETDLLNNLYSQISFINNCVVYGDDSMDGPLAIISVDKYLLFLSLKDDNMLEMTGVNEQNYLDKLTDDNINNNIFLDYVKEKMLEVYKETNLNRYNIINNIYLTSKVWDTNNYLTPTFKVKRFYVFKDYAFFISQVKEIYNNKLKGCAPISVNSENKDEEKKNDSKKKEEKDSEKLSNESTSNQNKNDMGKHEKYVENKKVKLGATYGTRQKEMNK
ncbi:acyl-CoA synthetase [Plasmodium falciparum NF54]|uniref:Acyl-CoA synthetase n=2 Tax=Plasmodium falciparum TaxID=5833 RepID=Q8I0X2_PLAF7|nr:acyl-CoA synthetase [Plasmodium falciparum 3D7]KAF4327327.1 acyl-CoA synthetase [Plasmodium falciparum NF54]PKC48295.1 acyl-CoA synthetase [Plasmodium falciparum NF54]CZT99687.1 acyl-CoA synthetase [Plasmodium falciparum 3D7]|eukprot:XP_001350916.1 acyl-CoA synthetase [Plasmodium falciparum 3D7]